MVEHIYNRYLSLAQSHFIEIAELLFILFVIRLNSAFACLLLLLLSCDVCVLRITPMTEIFMDSA